VLIAACIAILAAPVNSQQRPNEPTSLLCQGKAVSPILGPGEAEITLSSTIDFDRKLELVLRDDNGKQELGDKIQTIGGTDESEHNFRTYVRTGSLTVQESPTFKRVVKMLWHRAGLSEDFIGFAIDIDETSVLRVDSHPYETGESTQMPFDYYDGVLNVLYRGTCVGH